MAARPCVVVTRRLPGPVETRLGERFDVRLNSDDMPLDRSALARAMAEADALVPTVSDRIDAAILDAPGRRARIVANVGVGVSNIDTEAARRLGIAVCNTPDVLTDATADIALYLILAATRRTSAAERMLRAGRWRGFSVVGGLGTSVQGRVLGIVGMGRIGRATARRATALGMSVVYYNRSPVAGLDFPAEALGSIDEVMRSADVASIHVPGGGATPAVTAAHVAAMKPTAFLVNTARGDSIDQDALVDALEAGRIAGAGLDVYADEPAVPDRLLALPNVTLLPHVGSATDEVRTAMGMLAVDNLEAFFAGRELPCRVV